MVERPSFLLDLAKVVPLVLLLAILQVASAPQFTSSPGGPDLVLIVVVALAMWRSLELAAITGFCAGLLIDAMSFSRLGTLSLLYVLAAVVVANRTRPEPNPGTPGPPPMPRRLVMWTVAAALLVQVSDALLHELLGTRLGVSYLLSAQIVPSVLQTGLCALILSPLLKRLFARTVRRDVPGIAPA